MNKLIPVSAILLGVFIVAAAQAPARNPVRVRKEVSPTSLIAGYKNWVKVNREPFGVSAIDSQLCRALSPEEIAEFEAKGANNPHFDHSKNRPEGLAAFVNVYVNPVAKDALLHEKKPLYPIGSVIVKEKLLTEVSVSQEKSLEPTSTKPLGFIGIDSQRGSYKPEPAGLTVIENREIICNPKPVLLTVMEKREKGYNPESGDWNYLVFDGEGKKIESKGRLESCQSCHEQYKDRDYVVRSYLPRELWDKLK